MHHHRAVIHRVEHGLGRFFRRHALLFAQLIERFRIGSGLVALYRIDERHAFEFRLRRKRADVRFFAQDHAVGNALALDDVNAADDARFVALREDNARFLSFCLFFDPINQCHVKNDPLSL